MDYTAGVIVLLNIGHIPMVYEESKDWKYPSGHKEFGERPEETACRELFEETGIKVLPVDLKLAVREYRKTHWFYLFTTLTYDERGYKIFGNDGERNSIFTPKEILTNGNINRSHFRLTEKLLRKLANPAGFAQSA